MSQREYNDGNRHDVKEWRERYREIVNEWKERMKEWGDMARSKMEDGSLPKLPPLPSSLPLPFRSRSKRSNVVASRIGNHELHVIDMLVDTGLFDTRSGAVAYLVSEGIEARRDVIDRVSAAINEISKIRQEAQDLFFQLRNEIDINESKNLENKKENEDKYCKTCGSSLKSMPRDIKMCPYCGFNLLRR